MSDEVLEVNFLKQRFKQNLSTHKTVIEKYKNGFEDAKNLKGNIPIFLDANILLRNYSISFKAREQMKNFLNNHLPRLVITGQVQWEYVKNRESVINRFFKDVTAKIPESFSIVINHLNQFIDLNKVVLGDYPKVETKLNQVKKNSEDIFKQLETEVKAKKDLKTQTVFEDEFLDLLSSCKLLDKLLEKDIDKLKLDYIKCLDGIEKVDIDKDTFKTFPGCGEKKEKKDDPYGDYIIFHEIMKYSKENNTDAIFLTYDTTKGDWIKKDGSAHLHYIENFYLNTGQIIYILDAERLLEDLFNTSFESLIETNSNTVSILTEKTLKEYLINNKFLKIFETSEVPSQYIQELFMNGFTDLDSIDLLFNQNSYDLISYLNFIRLRHPQLIKFGALRAVFVLYNPNYIMRDAKLNTVVNSPLHESASKWKNDLT